MALAADHSYSLSEYGCSTTESYSVVGDLWQYAVCSMQDACQHEPSVMAGLATLLYCSSVVREHSELRESKNRKVIDSFLVECNRSNFLSFLSFSCVAD